MIESEAKGYREREACLLMPNITSNANGKAPNSSEVSRTSWTHVFPQEDADFELVTAGPDSEVRWVVQAVCGGGGVVVIGAPLLASSRSR
jgi:hypothetical protein